MCGGRAAALVGRGVRLAEAVRHGHISGLDVHQAHSAAWSASGGWHAVAVGASGGPCWRPEGLVRGTAAGSVARAARDGHEGGQTVRCVRAAPGGRCRTRRQAGGSPLTWGRGSALIR